MSIGCLIVDDEPLAHEVLKKHIQRVPGLEWVGSCFDALEATAFLHRHAVDLMFLDIQMPGLSGMELLRSLTYMPGVIITSAHAQHALESYEYSVLDYLLKPIGFERFLKAVNKAIPRYHEKGDSQGAEPAEVSSGLFVKVDRARVQLPLSEITRIQGCGNYVEIHLQDRSVLASETMNAIEARLPSDCFVRIHKSHIVNLARVTRVEAQQLSVDSQPLPIGATYKRALEHALDRMHDERRGDH